MPIYEYQCKHCLYQKDTLQKMSDAPLTLCPECHQESFERLVSAAGFQLKGSGWYVTDFKDKPKTADVKSDTTKATASSEVAAPATPKASD